MEKLVENSVRLYSGIIIVYPQFYNKEEELHVSDLAPEYDGMFNTNNSTVAYCFQNEFYCTPITREALETLRANGFIKGDLPVPLSNWDYPKDQKAKWDELKERAKEDRKAAFTDECISYSKKHGIGALPKEILGKCLEMPDKGIMVLYKRAKLPFKQTYFPILRPILDVTAVERIGRYNESNGVIAFIYQNGKTMLARDSSIIADLKAAGYREAAITVPLSEDVEIIDPDIKARWESLKK